MATIKFKAKVQTVFNMDDTVAYHYIQVPEFDRKHCDMQAFRQHPKYGGLANSDLFKGALAKIRREKFGGNPLRLDNIPAGVSVDTTGFLAVVTTEA